MQELEGEATISAPTPKDPQWAATNLITNLENRTSGNNIKPLIDWESNEASYESCYKTTNVELGPLGD